MRNFKKIVDDTNASGAIPERYDISTKELEPLIEQALKNPNGAITALCDVFVYGFVMGSRATRAGRVKTRL